MIDTMALYKKIEKEGDQATYEELKVVPSNQVIQLGAAYNHLMETCGGITPEVAAELLTLAYTACNGPFGLYGQVEQS